MPEHRPRSWRRLVWWAGGLCLLGGAAGAVVAETVGSGATAYRTATATDASVQSLLAVAGSVSPVSRSTATFEVAGTVASVAVHVGQQVTAGETLATLDTTPLEQAVTSAQSSLSAAEAGLSADEAAQASTVDPPSTTASLSSTSPGTTATGRGSGATGSGSGTAGSSLATAQQAVVSSQAAADAQAKRATLDLAHAESVCAPSGGTGAGGTVAGGTGQGGTGPSTRTGATGAAGTGTGPGHTGTGSPTTAKNPSTGATGSQTGHACTDALTIALDAENQLSADQEAVSKAEDDLARILTSASASGAGSNGGGTNGASTSPASGTRCTTPGNHAASACNAGTASTGSTAAGSAARLARDQSTIDTDRANLIEARQALAAATLVSPISGTVAAVNLSAGESVGAGSTSDAITVVDQGGYEATGSLTAGEVQKVEVGDRAIVSVDGESHDLSGVVTRVGPVDVGSGNTYPIVVELSHAAGLFIGSSAQIEVVVGRADHVVSVPTSAVHTDGAGHSYVVTVRHGAETHTPVTIGVVGTVDTQILSGLHTGETVVLADLTAPVPTSSSTSGRFGPTGGGFVNGPIRFRSSPARGAAVKGVAVTG